MVHVRSAAGSARKSPKTEIASNLSKPDIVRWGSASETKLSSDVDNSSGSAISHLNCLFLDYISLFSCVGKSNYKARKPCVAGLSEMGSGLRFSGFHVVSLLIRAIMLETFSFTTACTTISISLMQTGSFFPRPPDVSTTSLSPLRTLWALSADSQAL